MAHPTLRQGMKGNKGTELGTAIYNWRVFMGLTPAGNVVVYDFGAGTHDKTKAWQKKVGFTGKDIDGVVGPKSWAKYDAIQAAAYTGPMAAVSPAIQAAAAAAAPYIPYMPPGAQQAAEVIAATSPAIPQAVASAAQAIAAAAVKPPRPKPPKPPKPATSATVPPKAGIVAAVVASPFFELPKSFTEAKDQFVKKVEATPLWLRIVTGAGSGLLAIIGISKLTGPSKKH